MNNIEIVNIDEAIEKLEKDLAEARNQRREIASPKGFMKQILAAILTLAIPIAIAEYTFTFFTLKFFTIDNVQDILTHAAAIITVIIGYALLIKFHLFTNIDCKIYPIQEVLNSLEDIKDITDTMQHQYKLIQDNDTTSLELKYANNKGFIVTEYFNLTKFTKRESINAKVTSIDLLNKTITQKGTLD